MLLAVFNKVTLTIVISQVSTPLVSAREWYESCHTKGCTTPGSQLILFDPRTFVANTDNDENENKHNFLETQNNLGNLVMPNNLPPVSPVTHLRAAGDRSDDAPAYHDSMSNNELLLNNNNRSASFTNILNENQLNEFTNTQSS